MEAARVGRHPGADHMDFSADGSYLMISTEYSGVVAKVDVNKRSCGFVKVGVCRST
jgi:hypothetical protein